MWKCVRRQVTVYGKQPTASRSEQVESNPSPPMQWSILEQEQYFFSLIVDRVSCTLKHRTPLLFLQKIEHAYIYPRNPSPTWYSMERTNPLRRNPLHAHDWHRIMDWPLWNHKFHGFVTTDPDLGIGPRSRTVEDEGKWPNIQNKYCVRIFLHIGNS